MNAKSLYLFAILVSLVSQSILAQQVREIIIEPANPTSHDLITISVTDSDCWGPTFYQEDLQRGSFRIRLAYGFVPHGKECSDEYPYSDGYSRVIGPLAAGGYSIEVMLTFGNRTAAGSIRLKKNFAVTQAAPADVLSDGGITGLYYNPNDDGHYISILQTDFNTLVIWNTFGHSGSPGWVYGVGQLERGSLVVADSYINRSEGFSDGDLQGLEVIPWGTMEVIMDDCIHGTFSWNSNLPEFGSGEFPIERLAFSRQIGCEEID